MRCAVAQLRFVSRRNPVFPFVAPAEPNPMVARTTSIKVAPGGRWLPGRLSEGELQLRDGAISPVCTDQAGNIDMHDVEW